MVEVGSPSHEHANRERSSSRQLSESSSTLQFMGHSFKVEEVKKATRSDSEEEEEEDERADVIGVGYSKPTVENLKEMELRQVQGFMGDSLVDMAMKDMKRVNAVRSEMNAQGQLKAGSMFKSLDIAQKIGGMFHMNPLSMMGRGAAGGVDCRQSVDSGSGLGGGGARSLRGSFIGTGLLRGVASHVGSIAKAKDSNKIQLT